MTWKRPWAVLLFAAAILPMGCGRQQTVAPAAVEADRTESGAGVLPALPESPPVAESADSPLRLTDVAAEVGINFTYHGNPSPQHYMTEVNGGGVSLFDFDGDGRLDVFLVNGSHFDNPAEDAGASNALYAADGEGRYRDVAAAARLTAYGFGMGSAAGDFDNDGFVDLFVCYYGKNRLWQNNGDGTFTEVTDDAGVGDARWGASAAFADLDGDGNLDLYVCNYVKWSPDEPYCYSPHKPKGVHIACGPMQRHGQSDVLYRNSGDGRYEDVSQSAGVAIGERSKGLAVLIVDLDEDGLLDIYVANDTTENLLFRNAGGMRFEESALVLGVAVGDDGIPQAGMGIACADFTGNGHLDLFVTNFAADVNDFYENMGRNGFRAINAELGFDATSRPLLGFGTLGVDFDLDQWPDIFITNGHVWDLTSLGLNHQYEMQPQMFRNLGGQRFADVSAETGDYFRQKWLGRAVAAGDLDNDGDGDLVVTHLARPVSVLRNESRRAGGSMRLKLIGIDSSRQPLGARVEFDVAGRTQVTHVPAGGSFQATSDDRLLLSTGDASQIEELRVHWPAGQVEAWNDLPVRPELTLHEGSGRPQTAGDVQPVSR